MKFDENKFSYLEDFQERTEVFRAAPSEGANFIKPIVYGDGNIPLADTAYPDYMQFPEKKLDIYADCYVYPRHVIMNKDGKVLSASFMRNRKHHHGGIKHIGNDLYTLPNSSFTAPVREINEPIYHADTDHPEVFGHVLLEAIPALWAKDLIGERNIKIATSVKMNKSYASMFQALDIKDKDICYLDSPVKSDKTFVSSKIIQRRKYIDPISHNLFERVKNRLIIESRIFSPERVYISRSKVPGRELVNELEVEELFRSKGFAIIHPQELSIYDQINIFSSAKLIAGVGGSAMHNTLFSASDAKVLIVCSRGWLVVADSLICQNEGQLGYIFGSPLVDLEKTHRTQGQWSVNIEEVKDAIKQHFDL